MRSVAGSVILVSHVMSCALPPEQQWSENQPHHVVHSYLHVTMGQETPAEVSASELSRSELVGNRSKKN